MMTETNQFNPNTRRHQTTVRLTDEQYQQLKTMSSHSKMSDVLIKGLAVEWDYFNNVEAVAKKLPKFQNQDELAAWTARQFKDSPELLSQYSNAAAIHDYTKEVELKKASYQIFISELDTTNYLIRKIGNNLNQLAHQANSGIDVPKSELIRLTGAIVKIADLVAQMKREVS